VITQETGFSNALPTGKGLFAFSTLDDALAAVDAVTSDYEGHCRAAGELARQCFSYDVVLPQLLREVDMWDGGAPSCSGKQAGPSTSDARSGQGNTPHPVLDVR
jgi:hypothetical protein